MVFLVGDIVTTEQMGEGRELLGPGKFFQHTAQVDHTVRACDRGQWWVVRPQEGQPIEDMGMAAKLIERPNLRIRSAEISQKEPDGSAIGGDGRISEGSGHRIRCWPEESRQRVCGEWKAFSFHGCNGGAGRMCWATARAYCSQTSCGVS